MLLARWIRYRQARTQKKKALHMLALSGVIRPSTTELRYATSPLRNSTGLLSNAEPSLSQETLGPVSASSSSHLANQLYSTAFALVTESKRHIQRLHGNNKKAA